MFTRFRRIENVPLKDLGVRHPDGTEQPLADLCPFALRLDADESVSQTLKRAVAPGRIVIRPGAGLGAKS